MSEQRENMPDNFDPVKGETGNHQLDRLFKEIAEEPLVFSKEEAIEIIGVAFATDAVSTTINRTVVVGGAVLLTAISGWLYYQFNSSDTKQVTPEKNAVEIQVPADANNKQSSHSENAASYGDAKATMTTDEATKATNSGASASETTTNSGASASETTNNATVNAGAENYSANNSANKNSELTSERNAASKTATLKTETNKRRSITLVTKSEKKGSGKLVLTKTPDAKTGSMTLQKARGSSNSSKAKVAQRFYADGSATVAFEYNKEPAVITINPRGIEQLTINKILIKPEDYCLYEEIAAEAFRRAKIESLSEPTHNANEFGDMPGIMTRALIRRKLIKADEKFDFVITGANAFLNGKALDEEQRLDLLQVYQSASGKPLPKEGRFSVKQ